MSSVVATTAIRARFLDIQNTVAQARDIHDQVRYVEDGLLISQNGKIQWFGPWSEGQNLIPDDVVLSHYPEQLIVPGFIDTHIHFPQTEMVGAYGTQLLEWLNTTPSRLKCSLLTKTMQIKLPNSLSKS